MLKQFHRASTSALPLSSQYQSLLFLLDSCTSIRRALQIQSQLFITGLHRERLFLSKLISFFSLFSPTPSSLSHSLLIFSLLSRPNAFIFNTLIRASALSETPLRSISLYRSMISTSPTLPNRFTFPSLLHSCAKFPSPELGRQVHCHVMRLGFDSNVHVRNTLIGFYSGFGDLVGARRLFDEITKLDVFSCNVMIASYNKGGQPGNGLRVFGDMVGLGVKPDRCTFVCLMAICSKLGDLKYGKMAHMLALKSVEFDDFGSRLKLALVNMYAKLGAMKLAEHVFYRVGADRSTALWSCMVSGYAECGEIEIARRLFDEMPVKDLISWTAMICAYSHNEKYKETLELYREMEKEGIQPDEVTLTAVISACAHLGNLDMGKRLHLYADCCFLGHNNSRLWTAIVDMYAKCGCIGTAIEIFDLVVKEVKTASLFNSVITSLAQHGLGERAISVFREMEALGLSPDEVTFVGVLSACSHNGLVARGKEFFDLMVMKYGICPQIEHYGCMVDLLGREGYLDEAYNFIENMPISPNSVIWAALLRNCRILRNAKIGEIAERNLLKFGSSDFSSEGRGSCLVEMFLDTTSSENEKKVRKMTRYNPVRKQKDASYVEWNDSLHQFHADSISSHPQYNEICLMLEEMKSRLKLSSHDATAEEPLFDILNNNNNNNKRKRKGISHHSEKLALAFGLINLGPAEMIRIKMDLRMCTDCHSSFKLVSKVFSREITVSDNCRALLL